MPEFFNLSRRPEPGIGFLLRLTFVTLLAVLLVCISNLIFVVTRNAHFHIGPNRAAAFAGGVASLMLVWWGLHHALWRWREQQARR